MNLQPGSPHSAAVPDGVAIVVMGVSGCGKSTLGRQLATALSGRYLEGDEYHSAGNLAKLSAGSALTDDDRRPWLQALADELALTNRPAKTAVVLACSALRHRYREVLRTGRPDLRFIHLALSQAEAERRLRARQGHFMNPDLISSQYAALEQLAPDEQGLTLDATHPNQLLVAQALQWLGAEHPEPADRRQWPRD